MFFTVIAIASEPLRSMLSSKPAIKDFFLALTGALTVICRVANHLVLVIFHRRLTPESEAGLAAVAVYRLTEELNQRLNLPLPGEGGVRQVLGRSAPIVVPEAGALEGDR